MATNPYVAGHGAADLRGVPIHGVQVPGQGQAAAKGAGYLADGQGDLAATVTRQASANGVVAAGAGQNKYQACTWLDSILITTSGTAEVVIYDNAGPAGTASGNIVAIIPAAGQTRGQRITVNAPVTLGGVSIITAANTPAFTFFYD